MNSEHIPGQLEAEFAQIARRQRGRLFPARPTMSHSTEQRARSKPQYKQWGRYLLDFLTGQQQLSIREQRCNGQCQWSVYDPQTQHRRVFLTQAAVRAWLEQRYHR